MEGDTSLRIPGPSIPGNYSWLIDLDNFYFSYECADGCSPEDAQEAAPSHTRGTEVWDSNVTEVFVYGSAIEGGVDITDAVELKGSRGVFTGTTNLNFGGFRFVQSRSSTDLGLGVMVGSVNVEFDCSFRCGIGALLALTTSYQEYIPGPSDDGMYTINLNLNTGIVSYMCATGCQNQIVDWDGTVQEIFGLTSSTQLFIIGNATSAGWRRQDALNMTRDPSSEIFRATIFLQPGSFKFVFSKTGDDTGIGLSNSIDIKAVPEGCVKCGVSGLLTGTDGELQGTIPGPTIPGLYSIVANLRSGRLIYLCADNCNEAGSSNQDSEALELNQTIQKHVRTTMSSQLFIVGGAVNGWRLNKGVELIKEFGSNIFSIKLQLKNGRGGFKFARSNITRADGQFATSIGGWSYEDGNCFKCGVSGNLQEEQYVDGQQVRMDIPGPRVKGVYEITADLDAGTFSYKCAEKCDKPWTPTDVVYYRDTFVHLFEWSYSDIAYECEEWLGPRGYKAVQISPPQEHRALEPYWWARYQPVSYNLTTRSGNEEELADMVKRCKAVGVDIYADTVINHMAGKSGVGTAGSHWNKQTNSYPIYGIEDFHHIGVGADDPYGNCKYDDPGSLINIWDCSLYGMPDLATESEQVQETILTFLNHLEELGLGGFRVDAAMHMNVTALSQIFSNVSNSTYRVHEVMAKQVIDQLDYAAFGQVTEMRFHKFVKACVLVPGQLDQLVDANENSQLLPAESAVVFMNNHDSQRAHPTLTFRQHSIFTLATVFMLASPYGYPKVLSSYNFTDYGDYNDEPPGLSVHEKTEAGDLVRCGEGQPWICEHRWPAISNMVQWRLSADSSSYDFFKALDGNHVYLCRGSAACLALNRDEESSWSVELNLTMPAGKYCDVIHMSDDNVANCTVVEVDTSGRAFVTVPPIGAVAVHIGVLAATGSLVGSHYDERDETLSEAMAETIQKRLPASLSSARSSHLIVEASKHVAQESTSNTNEGRHVVAKPHCVLLELLKGV